VPFCVFDHNRSQPDPSKSAFGGMRITSGECQTPVFLDSHVPIFVMGTSIDSGCKLPVPK
jgi:hypothetical protein